MNDTLSIPPEAQQLLVQMQTFQQQYQAVAMQKETLKVQKTEIERALEELSRAKDSEEVYKAVGPILVRTEKKDLVKDLEEKSETIGLRLKSFEKQEDKLKEKINELQQKLASFLKGSSKPAK